MSCDDSAGNSVEAPESQYSTVGQILDLCACSHMNVPSQVDVGGGGCDNV